MANLQTAIEDAVYASMRQILDHLGHQQTQIIFFQEGGLEPQGTYVGINILTSRRTSRVQEATASPIDAESENVYTNYYTLMLQISVTGKDAENIMFDFSDSVFSSRRCIEYWQMHLLGPLTQSDVRRIPQLRETKWIKNYNIDLNLSFSVQSRETIDWIEFFTVEDDTGFSPETSPTT